MTIETHSMLGSMRDCSWWWEADLASSSIRHLNKVQVAGFLSGPRSPC